MVDSGRFPTDRNRGEPVAAQLRDTDSQTRWSSKASTATGLTLLVADDDPDIRVYVRQCVLGDRGPIRRVLEAADGEAALALIGSERPDVLVCDLLMPRLGGLALCEALRADPHTSEIAILLISGSGASGEAVRRAREVGADAILMKPFNARRLCIAVEDVIRARSISDRADGADHVDQPAKGER